MKTFWKSVFNRPGREYALIVLLLAAFSVAYFLNENIILYAASVLAVIPSFANAYKEITRRKIGIDTFNTFAIIVSFATGQAYSAGFIALMLTFARLLDWRAESRTHDAVKELMDLKPQTATIEVGGQLKEVAADSLKLGDVAVVTSGGRIPADGTVIQGQADVNEATVTGESLPVEKIAGDQVIASTLVESGMLKIRAERVGGESTIERMAAMMREASRNKSHSEKLADRFAAVFLPVVLVIGIITYLITHDLLMVAALFLIACADDMAVAIPLAMTAALGQAAKRGAIVKGGVWLDVLGKIKILVLDKTGTLTFGNLSVGSVRIAPGIETEYFWRTLASAEKYSEHPVGRAAYHEAMRHVAEASDPEQFTLYKGSGVRAKIAGQDVVAGTARLFEELGLAAPVESESGGSLFYISAAGRYLGAIEVADTPRPEAVESLKRLRELGIGRIIMFTGDNEKTAAAVAQVMGITEYYSAMKPEDKLRKLEELLPSGPVGMVGDGVNDAPVLARADVGIAMGQGGAAVSVEAADIVLMNDNISLLPEMVMLGRRTFSIIRLDAVIWAASNLVGFALVLSGLAGPAFAAFYNFATDFLPLLNSSRLFKKK